jgi:hypothetical protein
MYALLDELDKCIALFAYACNYESDACSFLFLLIDVCSVERISKCRSYGEVIPKKKKEELCISLYGLHKRKHNNISRFLSDSRIEHLMIELLILREAIDI